MQSDDLSSPTETIMQLMREKRYLLALRALEEAKDPSIDILFSRKKKKRLDSSSIITEEQLRILQQYINGAVMLLGASAIFLLMIGIIGLLISLTGVWEIIHPPNNSDSVVISCCAGPISIPFLLMGIMGIKNLITYNYGLW